MRVAVSGASGLIGSALVRSLQSDDHEVLRLVRGEPRTPAPDEVRWNPTAGYVDIERLEGLDAVVHMAATNPVTPWLGRLQDSFCESRVDGTGTISAALAQLTTPPQVFVCGSAIGYYGDGGDAWLDETSPVGSGFAASVVRDWEAAADPARAAGIRVVHARTGLVMTRRGGILPLVTLPFRLGVGGKIGPGTQYWSGISLADEVSALRFMVVHPELSGPVNVAAPNPATNAEWSELIGRALHRPTAVTVPRFLLKIADQPLDDQATEMLLFSQRIKPAALLSAGFEFAHPDPPSILEWALSDRR
jgi:uncharacterized protein (TIGR01777 family)